MNLNQQQLIQLEILKLQQQQQQQTPMPQNMQIQNQFQSAPPVFGAGFMNAAQLLANVQQFSQPQQQQPLTKTNQMSFQDKAQPPQTQPQNPNYLSNLNTLYSNLNHYQVLIEQIEKQGQTPQQQQPQQQFNTVSNSNRPQQQTQYLQTSQQQSQYPVLQNLQNLNSGMNPSDMNSRLPLQQNIIKQNYLEGDVNSSMSQGYGNNVMNNGPDTENQQRNTYGQPFNYEQKQSQSKERPYNPNAYSAQQFSNDRSFSNENNQVKQQVKPSYLQNKTAEDDYRNTDNYQQKSPPRNQNQNRGRENYSPSGSLYNQEIQQNESIQWLSVNNQPLNKISNRQSPIRQSARQLDDFGTQGNFLESSFRNQNMNQNSSNSQNSILQEQHQNSYQAQKQGYGAPHQYSPAGSQYRMDDAENSQHINFNRSQRALNIDDIPIQAPKARNFEELLEQQLRQNGMDAQPYNEDNQSFRGDNQKKNFLKRKSKKQSVQPTHTKKYNYYVDNFDENRKNEKKQETSQMDTGRTQDPKIQHYEVNPAPQHHPRAQTAQTEQAERVDTDQKSTKTKKKFLTRGTGTAGGRKGYDKSATRDKTKERDETPKQQETVPRQPRTQRQSQKGVPQINDDEYQQNDQYIDNNLGTKSPKPQNSLKQLTNQKQTLDKQSSNNFRNSIIEFEKIEQECIDKYSPQNVEQIKTRKAQEKQVNKKKKKLFDDSDSDQEVECYQQQEANQNQTNEYNNDYQSQQQQQQQYQSTANEEAPKSNVVKKFFYKDEQKSNLQQPSKIQPPNSQNPAVSDEMERMVAQKIEQLNKAMEKFNLEQDFHNKKKLEYEKLIQRVQVEKREFDGMKKKAMEEVERLKEEEINKIKKEKKALEQRSKNLQLVGGANKKEREEVDFLKKELQRVQDDAKNKEQKQKMTIDRLKKQVEDLSTRNKELSDELKHVELMRLQGLNTNNNSQQQKSQTASQLKPPSSTNSSRYTFSSNNPQQEQQVQQPKSILKNTKNSDSKKMSSPVKSDDQDQDYQDEEDNLEEEDRQQFNDDDDQEEEEEAGYDQTTQQKNQQQQQLQSQYNQLQQQRQQQQQQPINQTVQRPQTQTSQQSLQQPHQQQVQQQPVRVNPQQEQKLDSNQNSGEANEEEDEDYDMKFPADYHNKNPNNMKVIEQIIGHDGKIQRLYENGKKEVIFNNGVKREVFPDGYTIVYFNNNDIKQTYPDQKVVYYFADAKTTQTTFADGLQVFKFSNNQVEKHFPDGTKEIIFPDGTIKCIFADGEEESIFPDGTIQRIEKNGVKAIEFANGQKDILFPDGTRIREFPDGRVRKTFPDGTFENNYRQQ